MQTPDVLRRITGRAPADAPTASLPPGVDQVVITRGTGDHILRIQARFTCGRRPLTIEVDERDCEPGELAAYVEQVGRFVAAKDPSFRASRLAIVP